MIHKRNATLAGIVVLLAIASTITIGLAIHAGRSGSAALVHAPQPSNRASDSIASTPAATPAPTPTPTPTPVPSARPAPPVAPPAAYVSYFKTLPPGSALPSDAQCAREIARNPWEPKPENRSANQLNVYAQGFRLHNSYLASWYPPYETRVTGNYTGTTDQILRWGACKWGFDEDTVRAQAVQESTWQQSFLGDCNGGKTQPETHGCASVGILQVKGADIPPDYPGVWPAAWTSTSFNVDFAMAVRRLCYEGKETWVRDLSPSYAAGDLWGCIGKYYSGYWHDAAANQYIQQVQAIFAAKTWTTF
jgi:autotransporter family porin